jgi:hypothetical protein
MNYNGLDNKIAIVTLYDGKYADICKYSVQNKMAYSRKYGYDFYYFDEYLDKTKSFNYNKMLVVGSILDTGKYEWVWWVNIDSVILNFGIGLDGIIDDKYELIFTKNSGNVITTGSCFFKNTELVRSFINGVCDLNCEYMKWVDHNIFDQYDPFVSYLLNFGRQYLCVTKLIDERVCNSYCDDGISGGSVYEEGDFLIQFGYHLVECKAGHFFKYLLPKKVSVVLLASNDDIIESQKRVFDDSGYEIDYYMPRVVNKSNYLSFSLLINESVNYVDNEFIIFVNPKSVPNKDDVDMIVKNLYLGYALVTRINFGLFGTSKELFRTVGLLDERFIGGEYEDVDFILRLKLNNLAVYYEFDSNRYVNDMEEPSLYNKYRGLSKSIFYRKWKHDESGKLKISRRDLDNSKKPFNKLNVSSDIRYYWNESAKSFISNSDSYLNEYKFEVLVDDVEVKDIRVATISVKIKKTVDTIFVEYSSDVVHSELLVIHLIDVTNPKFHCSRGGGMIPAGCWWVDGLKKDILYEMRLYFGGYMLYSNILKDDLEVSMQYNVFV